MNPQNKSLHGFTLIEMLIAAGIFALLVTWAASSYQGQRRKAHRAVALTFLTELATRQEAQRLKTKTYAENFEPLIQRGGATIYLDRKGQISGTQQSDSVYQLDLLNPGPNRYTLRAQALGAQRKDLQCLEFSLSHTGRRLPTTAACWPT